MHRVSEMWIHSLYTPIRPGEFGNIESRSLEIFSRVLKVGLSMASLPLAFSGYAASYVIDSIEGRWSQKTYTQLLGTEEKRGSLSESFMTFNACMLWGGLPILFGGVRPARERIDRVASVVLDKDPDILLMQEVSFEAGLSLWDRIKHRYAHGFTRIGPMPGLALDSGLFIASKVPIVKEPIFKPIPSNEIIQRGVFYFETPLHTVFVTHLEAGDEKEDAIMRKRQLEEIVQEMQKSSRKPCLFLGDLNIKREGKKSDEYTTSGLPKHFDNFFNPSISEETSTCTNRLTAYAKGEDRKENLWEHIDYALHFKGSPKRMFFDVKLIPTYDLKKPSLALSDHKGLLFKLHLNISST